MNRIDTVMVILCKLYMVWILYNHIKTILRGSYALYYWCPPVKNIGINNFDNLNRLLLGPLKKKNLKLQSVFICGFLFGHGYFESQIHDCLFFYSNYCFKFYIIFEKIIGEKYLLIIVLNNNSRQYF